MKVESFLQNLAIVDAKRWSFHWQARVVDIAIETLGETLVDLQAKVPVNSIFQTRQETLT